MIIKSTEMKTEEREQMRGGDGTVVITHLVPGNDILHGRLMARIIIPAGASIGEHPHDKETEYYLILDGQGMVRDNGVDYPVAAGDTVVTPDGSSHSISNTGKSPLVMIAVIITE